MLGTMQNLALYHLWKEFGDKDIPPEDLRGWFKQKRTSGIFFPFLVESPGKIENFYTLSPDPDDDTVAILESANIESLGKGAATRLPFNKPSGPNSPQIGPVIKRSYSKQAGAGPKIVILNRTLAKFKDLSESEQAWAPYFKIIHNLLNRKTLSFAGERFECDHHSFHEAVKRINENKPVFLTAKDSEGRLPGDIPEYLSYLATMLSADEKYAISKAKAVNIDICPCCGEEGVKGYPAGLSKAGVNISNIDREGAFPGILSGNAHLSYAICELCADLLYVFKFHVLENYITYIAGQESLVLPAMNLAPQYLKKFLNQFKSYVENISKPAGSVAGFENKKLIKLLTREEAVCTIDILWSKDSFKGQSMGNLSGQITDVLPSRLRIIEEKNNNFKPDKSPFSPNHVLENFEFDLNLSFVQELLWRPGGKKAKNANQSQKLIEFKRLIVEAIYKGKNIPEERFWEEVMSTAGWYFLSLLEKDKPEMECLYEGYSAKKNITWMTFAGWIKHLAMTLHYWDYMGVRESMENKRDYFPEMEKLKKFFDDGCGINNDEKAFAFILGILYGRVMQVQGAKGVNVGANALTWLKRLTLSGKDLPEFYVKIREKLLSYDAEKSQIVRDVIKEAGTLGNKLGDDIVLSKITCCYFLLLGQSLAADLFSADKKNN